MNFIIEWNSPRERFIIVSQILISSTVKFENKLSGFFAY